MHFLLQKNDILAGRYRIERRLGTRALAREPQRQDRARANVANGATSAMVRRTTPWWAGAWGRFRQRSGHQTAVLARYPELRSTLWIATHVATEQRVVIEWLNPGGGKLDAYPVLSESEALRLLGPARAVARLGHPNLVGVRDAGLCGGWPFVVREWVPGQSLAGLLRAGPVGPRQLLEWLLPAMAGVAAARQCGAGQPLLRPGGILVGSYAEGVGRVVKVADVGLWPLRGMRPARAQGAPYLAPERCVSQDDTRECGDVYAFGAMLHEGLTGHVPEASDRAVRVAELPQALGSVVQRALAFEPGARFATVGALYGALAPLMMQGAPLGNRLPAVVGRRRVTRYSHYPVVRRALTPAPVVISQTEV